MKLFGQFLVEKGLISESDLLGALILEIKNLPTVCEIAYTEKLLSEQNILNALAVQSTEHLDFSAACKKIGVWSDDIEAHVRSVSAAKKIPLGQTLVRLGKLDFQTIVTALDEYLAGQGGQKTEAPPEKKMAITSEPAPEVAGFGSYADLLNQEKVESLRALLQSIKDPSFDQGVLLESLAKLQKGFHEIRGMARLVNAEKTEQLVKALETTIHAAISTPVSERFQQTMDLISDFGLMGIKIVVDLKDGMVSTGSEGSYLATHQAEYDHCLQNLDQFGKLISLKEAA